MKLMICARCGIPLTTIDADQAVATRAGVVHRECFQGPDDALDLSEENRRRREMGDPPFDEEAFDDDLVEW